MAPYCFPVVLMLTGFLAGATAVAGGAATSPMIGGGCEVSTLATELAASCVAGTPVTPSCCEPVVATVELGTACFCRVASETPVLQAGLNASALLALYTRCGGARACDVAGPTTASRATAVRALSTTVAADVPHVAGVIQPPQPIVVDVHYAGKDDSKIQTEVIICVAVAAAVAELFIIGMRWLHRQCYGPKAK